MEKPRSLTAGLNEAVFSVCLCCEQGAEVGLLCGQIIWIMNCQQ